jgi:superfamily I DNA/RNA helicase
LLILGDALSERQFEQMTQDAVVIIPCEEGQEDEFVRADPLLGNRSDQSGLFTVLSPMSAKGSEFGKVILYKYGDACPQGLFSSSGRDTARVLEDEYFLNKLYVAITRAMKYLLIVDTPRGEEVLWRHTLSWERLDEVKERAKSEKWCGKLACTHRVKHSDIALLETE